MSYLPFVEFIGAKIVLDFCCELYLQAQFAFARRPIFGLIRTVGQIILNLWEKWPVSLFWIFAA
jgi:hypothetical protein